MGGTPRTAKKWFRTKQKTFASSLQKARWHQNPPNGKEDAPGFEPGPSPQEGSALSIELQARRPAPSAPANIDRPGGSWGGTPRAAKKWFQTKQKTFVSSLQACLRAPQGRGGGPGFEPGAFSLGGKHLIH